MTSKENIPPIQGRKSKIPVPKLQSLSTAKKGMKRAISPSACSNESKRSPSSSRKPVSNTRTAESFRTGLQRKTLGELPCDQRKIVKVRRMLDNNSSTGPKGVKRATRSKPAKGKGDVEVTSTGRKDFVDDLSRLPDQSGIVFEKDDSALRSILDESGIQFDQPKTGNHPSESNFTRHTLAGVPEEKHDSATSSSMRTCVNNFRQVCDDFLMRQSSRQPNPKRMCTGTSSRNDENLNLKLTPSRTNFCAKYGVEKNMIFQGVRQSLPGRTRVNPLDPFAAPGRSSMVAQTPRRLATLREEAGLGTLGRQSLAVQTPQRVLKKVEEVNDCNKAGGIAGRENNPQTPGRVSVTASTLTRHSLVPGTQHRTSLAVQTPGRVSLYEKNANGGQSCGRMSITSKHLGNNCVSPQTFTQVPCPGRFSLASQTPGRVSLSAQKSNPGLGLGRLSMIEQTPGRVKLPKHNTEFDPCTVSKQTDPQNINVNLQGKFSLQTPGRVPRKEKLEDIKNENEIKKEEPTGSKDMVLKDCTVRTPLKDRMVPLCATPVRVKQLQAGDQTQKSTPQRVLKPVSTPQHTPIRVPITGASRLLHTPDQNSYTPLRHPVKISTPGTPSRILLTHTVTGSCSKDEEENQKEKSSKQIMILKETPSQDAVRRKTFKQETPNRKTPDKNRLGDGVDIRTFWKTKKTSKSPILKEVLTKESNTEVSTPTSSCEVNPENNITPLKRKKMVTWADSLASCQPSERGVSTLETEDERWVQEVKTQPSHDAMQDNPHQEKTTSSPTKDTHVTTLTDSQKSLDNMQLPICLTGSGSAYSASTSGSINVENQLQDEDPCLKADDTLLTHSRTFAQLDTDSLLVSQRELGQHHSNILANTTQNEFLQKQIELFEEKKRQLTQLQMQIQKQLFKASDSGPVSLEDELDNVGLPQKQTEQFQHEKRHARTADDNLMEHVKLDNHQFGKNLNNGNVDIKNTSYTSTQGISVSGQVNLDLNSNVTGTESTFDLPTEETKKKPSSPVVYSANIFSGTLESHLFNTPTQPKFTSLVEEDITPFILRNKSDDSTTFGEKENNKRRLEFEEVQFSEKDDAETKLVSVPLWTPLAMKTVAKQQTIEKAKEAHQFVKNVRSVAFSDNGNVKSECEPKIEFDAKTEIDTSVKNNEHVLGESVGLVPSEKTETVEKESSHEQCPQTPPKRKSAFCPVGRTGLTPVVGSLSLRANTTNYEKSVIHQSQTLHSSVLRVANERYLEALLDDEVALFMCRLSPGRITGKRREFCCDPVAKILLHGDDMHFIPVEMEYSETASAHIEGSAFTKYSIRAT